MSHLEDRLAELGKEIAVDWNLERSDRVEATLLRHYRRRVARRRAAQALLVLVIAGAGIFGLRQRMRPTHERAANEIQFGDGSLARLADEKTVLRRVTKTQQLMVTALDAGRAQFHIVHDPHRLFRVEAGKVAVEDLGTDFVLERRGAELAVQVLDGRVRVRWTEGEVELGRGMSGVYPPKEAKLPAASAGWEAAAETATEAEKTGAPKAERRTAPAQKTSAAAVQRLLIDDPAQIDDPPKPESPPTVQWRALAEAGDFQRAYEALNKNRQAVRDAPAELLLASDVARLSGHPADAVPLLERVLQDHVSDARAPLAAFTLGRVLLDELHRPGEAARAFASAEQLSPDGPLAEDALGREVEAWAKAGNRIEAHARAESYLARYPNGRREALVRKFSQE